MFLLATPVNHSGSQGGREVEVWGGMNKRQKEIEIEIEEGRHGNRDKEGRDVDNPN